jgi:hypothetical protein
MIRMLAVDTEGHQSVDNQSDNQSVVHSQHASKTVTPSALSTTDGRGCDCEKQKPLSPSPRQQQEEREDQGALYRRGFQKLETELQRAGDVTKIQPFDVWTEIYVWDWFPPIHNCPSMERVGRVGDGGKVNDT